MMVPVGYHGYETCSFMLMAEHKPRVFKKTIGSGEYLDLTRRKQEEAGENSLKSSCVVVIPCQILFR